MLNPKILLIILIQFPSGMPIKLAGFLNRLKCHCRLLRANMQRWAKLGGYTLKAFKKKAREEPDLETSRNAIDRISKKKFRLSNKKLMI